MLTEAYADTSVADLVHKRFLPVWVDAEQRPDISERYSFGGWPTTAFLAPDGRLLGGEMYASAERLLELLPQVADAFNRQRASFRKENYSVRQSRPFSLGKGPDASHAKWVREQLLERFDTDHGGFGNGAKRIQIDALELASQYVRAGDRAFVPVVERTRRAIAFGGLLDKTDGGVFRYCAGRDWSDPSTEKLLTINAAALRVFLEEDTYWPQAVNVLQFVRQTFVDNDDGNAGFFSSQQADNTYYSTNPAGERRGIPPQVDSTVYADGTSRMARAYVRAARVLNDESLLAFAVNAVEHVVIETYERGGGIAHETSQRSSMRGLLTDQVCASSVLLDLYQETEREVYLDMAQELMHFALRRLWDTVRGGFRDRVHNDDDLGLLREPIYPFHANCEAARVLARLARFSDRSVFRGRAELVLSSQNEVVRVYGVDGAAYVLALNELQSSVC